MRDEGRPYLAVHVRSSMRHSVCDWRYPYSHGWITLALSTDKPIRAGCWQIQATHFIAAIIGRSPRSSLVRRVPGWMEAPLSVPHSAQDATL